MKKNILFFILISFFNIVIPSEKSKMVSIESLFSPNKNDDIEIPLQQNKLLRSPTVYLIKNSQENKRDNSGCRIDVFYKK